MQQKYIYTKSCVSAIGIEVNAASSIGMSYGIYYLFHWPSHGNTQNKHVRISTSYFLVSISYGWHKYEA